MQTLDRQRYLYSQEFQDIKNKLTRVNKQMQNSEQIIDLLKDILSKGRKYQTIMYQLRGADAELAAVEIAQLQKLLDRSKNAQTINELLVLPENVSASDIEKAYKKMQVQLHPRNFEKDSLEYDWSQEVLRKANQLYAQYKNTQEALLD